MILFIIVVPVALFCLLYLFRIWMQGPTLGSDNPKRLDGQVVVITGKHFTTNASKKASEKIP